LGRGPGRAQRGRGALRVYLSDLRPRRDPGLVGRDHDRRCAVAGRRDHLGHRFVAPEAPMYVAAQNASDADVVIDADGSIIPAGQWGVVIPSNAEVAAPIASGTVHLYPFGAEGCEAAEKASAL